MKKNNIGISILHVRVSNFLNELMDSLIENKKFPSKSEIIRTAIIEFMENHKFSFKKEADEQMIHDDINIFNRNLTDSYLDEAIMEKIIHNIIRNFRIQKIVKPLTENAFGFVKKTYKNLRKEHQNLEIIAAAIHLACLIDKIPITLEDLTRITNTSIDKVEEIRNEMNSLLISSVKNGEF